MSLAADPSRAAPAARIRPETLAGLGLVLLPVAALVVLVLMPTLRMAANTVMTEEGPSLSRYLAFFTDAYSMANLRYTLILTTVSTLAALGLSLGIALYLRFSAGRIATLIHGLSLFPLFVPSIVISYALIRFLGPNGLLQMLLDRVGLPFHSPWLTPVGPFLAFVWENVPLPVLVLSAGLAQVSTASVEAARDLGAGHARILTEILMPPLRRSGLIAFALTFLGIVGSYTVPYMLGPPAPEMLGVFMQRTLGDLQDPRAAEVQAMVLIVIALAVGSLYIRSMVRR